MKILRLESENVKRLRAVEITPEGAVIVIGGRNAQGKSSVLDSISYALGGEKLCPSVPIHTGKKTAHVKIELEDLTITRTWTAGGSYLQVANRDGATYKSPQAILDRLVGRLSFDPLAFMREKPSNQAETLRALCGLDFSELDGKRHRIYEERREFGRELKQKQGAVANMPSYPDAAGAKIDVAEITVRITAAEAWRKEGDELAREAANLKRHVEDVNGDIKRIHDEIEARNRTLDQLAEEIATSTELLNAMVSKLTGREKPEGYIEPDALREELVSSAEHNRKVDQNLRKHAAESELATMVEQLDALSTAIEQIDTEKRAGLAAAKYPVEGLALGDDGVMLGGLPFEQASQAEQLRVSIAMGLALNPKLRVLLVRDGSLLDQDNLRLIAEMAKASDAQVWLERVGSGSEVSVLIEDGAVVDREAKA